MYGKWEGKGYQKAANDETNIINSLNKTVGVFWFPLKSICYPEKGADFVWTWGSPTVSKLTSSQLRSLSSKGCSMLLSIISLRAPGTSGLHGAAREGTG